jgi:L-alanine-DL-glutamate epimerase-like enolase superfamily enzyme
VGPERQDAALGRCTSTWARCELESVPAYASGGYYLEGKTPAMLGQEMASYVDKGFKAVKMKTGRLSPKEEEARLKAARDAVGPDIELMMDCNNGWTDTTQAMQYIRRFEAYDPYFIEEPFGPDDIDSHAKLARLTRIPVATAEIGYGRWYHKELLDKGAAAILQTDAAGVRRHHASGSALPPPPRATAW